MPYMPYMPYSPDWNDERLQTLRHIYPDLVTDEGRVNLDELINLVDPGRLNETERYELRWFGKKEAKRNAFTPSGATLIFDEHRSVNPRDSQNLIIEGDNLEVLKLLSGSYHEKIKCIYIDPPYNTGKDFVYSDRFEQDKAAYWQDAGMVENGLKIDSNCETDGRYHSNWLNMMYSRLLLARLLLRDDGVIFISIDDHEVHNLRKLCDEVYCEDNFIGQIFWQTATDNNPTQISTEHEYVVCYAKDVNLLDDWEIPSEKGKIIQAKYEELKSELGFNTEAIQNQLRKWIKRQSNEGKLSGVAHYSYVDKSGVYYPGNSANTKPGGYTYDIVHPVTKKVCAKPDFGYRWTEKTFQDADKIGDVQWGTDETTIPKIKKRLGTATQKLKSYYYEDNRATSLELRNLFDGKMVFNNPKSVNFLKLVFRFVLAQDDLMIDFFAGSGTSGQAVMDLNQDDGGHRQFILVQLPEATDPKSEAHKAGYKKISDITIERNKRVIAQLTAKTPTLHTDMFSFGTEANANVNKNIGADMNSDTDTNTSAPCCLGFKVFKLVKSHFARLDFTANTNGSALENAALLQNFIAQHEAQLVTAFNRQDMMTEILLKKHYTLNFTLTRQNQFTHNEVFLATDGRKFTLICLDVMIAIATVAWFKTNTEHRFICLERALDSSSLTNLRLYLGDRLTVI